MHITWHCKLKSISHRWLTPCCIVLFKVICKLKLLAYFVTNRSSNILCYHLCSMFQYETHTCHLPHYPIIVTMGMMNFQLPAKWNYLIMTSSFKMLALTTYLHTATCSNTFYKQRLSAEHWLKCWQKRI